MTDHAAEGAPTAHTAPTHLRSPVTRYERALDPATCVNVELELVVWPGSPISASGYGKTGPTLLDVNVYVGDQPLAPPTR